MLKFTTRRTSTVAVAHVLVGLFGLFACVAMLLGLDGFVHAHVFSLLHMFDLSNPEGFLLPQEDKLLAQSLALMTVSMCLVVGGSRVLAGAPNHMTINVWCSLVAAGYGICVLIITGPGAIPLMASGYGVITLTLVATHRRDDAEQVAATSAPPKARADVESEKHRRVA